MKSARVVGEVMGKLHPHGDAAIYDALVRLAQPFSLRLPLVDGHGNFGSLDDGPAAPRYTEARLAPAALVMTDGLDEDVVDFVPNYDNKLTQPEVLPAAFPNLLVNGASGIAVGMATNMAPHNLVEVIAAARHLIAHPDATLDDLMRFVPGPDLPIGRQDRRPRRRPRRVPHRPRHLPHPRDRPGRERHAQAQGHRRHRAALHASGPEKVIEKIKDARAEQEARRASPRRSTSPTGSTGCAWSSRSKTGFNPDAVLEQLYRLTPLEDSFGINNVALVDGQPRTLGLRELLRRVRRAPARRRAPTLAAPAGQAARSACTWSRACSSRSSTSTRSSR